MALEHRDMWMMRNTLTIAEQVAALGSQVRDARIAQNLDQASLARMADISINAVSNLERGKGSTLATFVAVVRALDRSDWLSSLAPAVTVSPMQILRSKRPPARRLRVRGVSSAQAS